MTLNQKPESLTARLAHTVAVAHSLATCTVWASVLFICALYHSAWTSGDPSLYFIWRVFGGSLCILLAPVTLHAMGI